MEIRWPIFLNHIPNFLEDVIGFGGCSVAFVPIVNYVGHQRVVGCAVARVVRHFRHLDNVSGCSR